MSRDPKLVLGVLDLTLRTICYLFVTELSITYLKKFYFTGWEVTLTEICRRLHSTALNAIFLNKIKLKLKYNGH